MSDRIKLKTKVTSFKETEESLRDIEKRFNELLGTIKEPAESEVKETKGDTGDIATNQNDDKTFYLQLRSEDGWSLPSLNPHYDSGWVTAAINSQYEIRHELDTKFLFLQIIFKDSSNNIFHLSHYGMNEAENSPTNTDTGISVFMKDNHSLVIGTADYRIFNHDLGADYGTGNYSSVTSGEIRVFAWRIGISE